MDYRQIHSSGGDLILQGVQNFNLDDILDCGQCFRWQRVEDHSWRGTVDGKTRRITQRGNELRFHGTAREEFLEFWHYYFDFDRDYNTVKEQLLQDPVMGLAIGFTPGMRVLRQPPWETLCSFIISANNNILRIRGIVERLCGLLGEPVEGGRAFPTPERLVHCTPEDLAPVRCGYRAGYLLDAARLVASGELELPPLYTAPLDEARAQLRRIKGVGPKVAECVLLYGFGRAECVPVDVWIGRALDLLYPGGMPPGMAPLAGIAQQYLFHYVRNCPGALQVG